MSILVIPSPRLMPIVYALLTILETVDLSRSQRWVPIRNNCKSTIVFRVKSDKQLPPNRAKGSQWCQRISVSLLPPQHHQDITDPIPHLTDELFVYMTTGYHWVKNLGHWKVSVDSSQTLFPQSSYNWRPVCDSPHTKHKCLASSVTLRL